MGPDARFLQPFAALKTDGCAAEAGDHDPEEKFRTEREKMGKKEEETERRRGRGRKKN